VDSREIDHTDVVTELTYTDHIASEAVKQLLRSFPMSEINSRAIGSTEFVNTLFATQTSAEGNTQVCVPKNIESFTNNMLMMSLLKIFEKKLWIPVVGEKELPTGVFETNDGKYFAGFVAASTRVNTGPLDKESSKWNKGVRSYQLFCVERQHGKSAHLKIGGMDKLIKRLSAMKGFTKDYWGLKNTIISIFKSIAPKPVTDLQTYMKSKPEIMKDIKTKFVHNNGGLFRAEEIAYLDARYRRPKEELERFLGLLDNPTQELAMGFNGYYTAAKVFVDNANNEMRMCAANRARLAFPDSKRKQDIAFKKKSLVEKLTELSEEKLVNWKPDTLPGITFRTRSTHQVHSREWIAESYTLPADLNVEATSVVESWHNGFVQE